jgi:hypothetical protein
LLTLAVHHRQSVIGRFGDNTAKWIAGLGETLWTEMIFKDECGLFQKRIARM